MKMSKFFSCLNLIGCLVAVPLMSQAEPQSLGAGPAMQVNMKARPAVVSASKKAKLNRRVEVVAIRGRNSDPMWLEREFIASQERDQQRRLVER